MGKRGRAAPGASVGTTLDILWFGFRGIGAWIVAAGFLILTVPRFIAGLIATVTRVATDVDLPVNLMTSLAAIVTAPYLAAVGWRYMRGTFDAYAREDVREEDAVRSKEFRYSLHLLRKSVLAMGGLVIIVVYVLIAVLGPVLAPFPYAFSAYEKHVPPGEGALDTEYVAAGDAVSASWTDTANALAHDGRYASSTTLGDVLILKDFRVPLVFSSSTVQAVDVGIQYYSDCPGCTEAQTLNVSVSWDAGVSWSADQLLPYKTSDNNQSWYLSFGYAHDWTSAELNSTALWVRLTHVQGNGPAFGVVRLDYAILRPTTIGPAHPWGTNELGEDMLSGILLGAATDIRIGVLTVFGAVMIGIVLGVFSGYLGRIWDEIIMRVTDMFLAVPGLILALAFVAILGRSLNNVLIALMLVSWPGYTRLVRGQVLSVREVTYVEAARAVGAPTRRIVWRHILPNVIAVVIVAATLDLGTVVIGTAALSFLGLGAQPYEAEWGIMIARGYQFMTSGYWWEYVPPGIAILLFVLAFNLFGDGLRDILDPRLRR